jgi:putative heme transporter
MSDADALPPEAVEATAPKGKRRSSRLQLVISLVVAVVVFVFILPRIIDYHDVLVSIRSLSWYEFLELSAVTLLKWLCEGAIYAAVLPSLGAVRGSVAYVASTAAVNTIPGPIDLAVRYRMYRTWGYQLEQASAAVVSGGIFSTLSKLVLPGVAAIIAFTASYTQDKLSLYAIVGTAIAIGAIVVVIILFRSERHARRLGDWAGRMVSAVKGRFGRPPTVGLGDRLAGVVAQSSTVVRSRWPFATAASIAANLANFAVLLMALRFSGVPQEALSWVAIFVAFASVQFLTVVPITSGNVGVSELVYIGTMGAVAGPGYESQVAAGVFIYRLFTWLAVIPIGWITMFVWEALHRRQGERVDLVAEIPEPSPET